MSAVLSSIERTAVSLDEIRKTRLKPQATGDSIDAYMAARESDIAAIKPAEDFREALHDEFHGDEKAKGLYLPWRKLDDLFRIRPGEVTDWAGYNGHMKSTVVGYVLLELLRQGEKGCVISLEMKPRKSLRRMASQTVGSQTPTPLYIDKFLDSVAGKLYLYDQQGDVDPERIFAVITYCAEQLGVTQFVVDSLMKVVRDEDDYNGQKRFISRLTSLARDLNIHIHIVTHARKGADESKRPGKQDNKGSGSIVDQVDNYIVVFKIPKKEGDTGPDFCLYFDKQRHGEWEQHIALWLDGALQFHESGFGNPICHV